MTVAVDGVAVGLQSPDDDFRTFVVGSQGRLLHIADLMTGDRGRAEDLVQHALTKTYLAWRRVRDGNPEAYARTVMLNARTDWWRRRTWREQAVGSVPDRPLNDDHAEQLAQRDAVRQALAQLTARERAVVVLRHCVGLTEAQTATELGCAIGTVKSTAARALAKLRADETLRREE